MQQNKFSWERLARVIAYCTLPILIASIGWLTGELANTISDGSSKSTAFAFMFLLLLLGLMNLFLIAYLNSSDVKEVKAGDVIFNIFKFTVLAFAMGTAINTSVNLLEVTYLSTWGDTNNLVFLLVVAVFLWLFHIASTADKPSGFKPTKSQWALLIGSLTYLFGTLFLTNETALTLRQGLALIFFSGLTLYCSYLFFRSAKQLIRPHNRLLKGDIAPQKKLIIFLSSLFDKSAQPPVLSIEKLKTQKDYQQTVESMKDVLLHIQRIAEGGVLSEAKKKALYTEHFQGHFEQLKSYSEEMVIVVFFEAVLQIEKKPNDMHLLGICERIAQYGEWRGRFHKWEMPLRAIAFHLETLNIDNTSSSRSLLEQLTIFASKRSETKNANGDVQIREAASVVQVGTFIYILQQYLVAKYKNKNEVMINLYVQQAQPKIGASYQTLPADKLSEVHYQNGRGLDFGSYEQLSTALMQYLEKDQKNEHRYADIVVDITGGTKPTSVAGALAATVLDVRNQYVDTATKNVEGYDFQYADFTKS